MRDGVQRVIRVPSSFTGLRQKWLSLPSETQRETSPQSDRPRRGLLPQDLRIPPLQSFATLQEAESTRLSYEL